MGQLSAVIYEHCRLESDDVTWLISVVREWHLLADTAFSDLVLWIPDASDPQIFWAGAQVRPVTGPTALKDDVVGSALSYEADSAVTSAYLSRQIVKDSEHNVAAGIPVEVSAIPIIRNGRCIAIVERHTNQMGVRAPGALEDTYMAIADSLCDMLHHGEFPVEPPSDPSQSPKVGDGILLVEISGDLLYASPNAVSYLRRLGISGDLVGENLRSVEPHMVNEFAAGRSVHGALAVYESYLERPDFTFRVRIIPLKLNNELLAILVLCRDVTQLVERERELVNKDATIREIHHRVKNNLQTVAALLRLQSRRISSAEGKDDLHDAMRRVQSIAAVHEILSQGFGDNVNFDDIADRILHMVGDVASTHEKVQVIREGDFGMMPGHVATSLSLVMTELCQNAIEHGFAMAGGTVRVRPHLKDGHRLTMKVIDDGIGLPQDFDLTTSHSLGLSIVSTLVTDLNGKFTLTNNHDKGSTATVNVSWPAYAGHEL